MRMWNKITGNGISHDGELPKRRMRENPGELQKTAARGKWNVSFANFQEDERGRDWNDRSLKSSDQQAGVNSVTTIESNDNNDKV